MKGFVLDLSVTAGWCMLSQSDTYTEAVLNNLGQVCAYVPDLWRYEVANFLLVFERRRMLARSASMEFLRKLNSLPIEVVQVNKESWSNLLLWMGFSHQLSAYDTAYLYLAMDRGWPLATRDKKLRAAAKSAGVSFYEP